MELLFPARLQCPACRREHLRLSGAAHHRIYNYGAGPAFLIKGAVYKRLVYLCAMKSLFSILFLMLTAAASAQQKYSNPNSIVDTFKKSIPCIASGKIGNADVVINYYSPGVKNRIIWGGLVPYNNVWVTGAHSATNITVSKDFIIDSKKINAGTYAIFTIPGKEEWIFIINKNYAQHLADEYQQEEDIIRVTVKPIITETSLERLQYFLESDKIIIGWEKIRIEIPFKIQ